MLLGHCHKTSPNNPTEKTWKKKKADLTPPQSATSLHPAFPGVLRSTGLKFCLVYLFRGCEGCEEAKVEIEVEKEEKNTGPWSLRLGLVNWVE